VSDIEFREVSPEEAIALVASGTALVDVREQGEWDAGHAPTATLAPMSRIDELVDDLPEGEFLVICHSGMRSQRVTEYLLGQGRDAVNVSGGMVAWQAAGGAVVPEPRP
jgi:rhodanese-related sulfurtransferase